jgi:hypothetical protein
MSKNNSTNGNKHPYMRPEMFNPFWRCDLYSFESQQRFETWLQEWKDSRKNPQLMEVRRTQWD